MKKLILALIITAIAAVIMPQAALALWDKPIVELVAGSVELTEVNGVKHIKVFNGHEDDYTGTVTIKQGANSSTSNTITIKSGSHDVVLEGATPNHPIHIKTSAAPPISVESGTLTLTIRGSVTLEATGRTYAGLRIAGGAAATITTEQDAMLTVKGSSRGGAGIGGNSDESSGKIILDGNGSIAATGGSHGAGIGGGSGGGSGDVDISGGTIFATGGESGAGIGGGYHGFGNVTITGGTINALSGQGAAGIGGGEGNPGVVSISGGTISALGNERGVGIGGGYGSGCDVDISGGTITASTFFPFAAIGADTAVKSININISNARIYTGTTAKPENEISQYTNESSVHIVGSGSSFSTTFSLRDAVGNIGTVGAGAVGGTASISLLDGNKARNIANQAGGRYVSGMDVIARGSGNITGVGFAVSNVTLGNVSSGLPIASYVIAHKMSSGNIEQLPVSIKSQGDIIVFTTTKAPSGASPFVLVMHVDDPPKPPKPPKTGDNNQPLIWLSLLLICGAGTAALTIRTRKQRG